MRLLGLSQGHRQAAAAYTHSFGDSTCNADLRALGRHSVVLAQNPDLAGAIVDLKATRAEETEARGDGAGNGDFFVGVAAGIAGQIANLHLLRAAQQDGSYSHKCDQQYVSAHCASHVCTPCYAFAILWRCAHFTGWAFSTGEDEREKEEYGRHERTRTADLFRVKEAL